MKVATAMSGGVDSSVAAALLKEAGHEVVGITMRTTDDRRPETDAADIAGRLGIAHHVIDLREVFAEKIIAYFCGEYGRGRTPNPCVLCNRHIKFGALRQKAARLGAAYFATGHYTRIEQDSRGRYILKKGRDKNKDQSYFLCQLIQGQLDRTIFPVGEMTKDEVRKKAAEMGLPGATRPESQEICFIPDNDHAAFVARYTAETGRPGPITDEDGRTLGRHRGIAQYTVGQRKGLGIAAAEPLYVTGIEPASNTVIVGTKGQIFDTELIADNINWISIDPPEHSISVKAKIRYRHAEAEATVELRGDGTVYVKFSLPQAAITPGQSVVFYDGEKVLGGGTIFKRGR